MLCNDKLPELQKWPAGVSRFTLCQNPSLLFRGLSTVCMIRYFALCQSGEIGLCQGKETSKS
jgi:hypothetical protein